LDLLGKIYLISLHIAGHAVNTKKGYIVVAGDDKLIN
jgi:hypothetical protein